MPSLRGRLAFSAAAAFLAPLVLAAHVALADWNGNPLALFHHQIDGTAHRPYVRRVLAPALVRPVEARLPEAWVGAAASSARVEDFFERRDWPLDRSRAYAAALVVLALALFGFAHALRFLLGAFVSEGAAAAAALAALAGLPALYGPYGYLYDLPHLALFTLALGLLARRRFGALLALLPLLALSKETALLVPLVFALHERGRLAPAVYRRLLLGQLGLCLAVEAALSASLAGRPGVTLELHLADHNLPLLLGRLEEPEGLGSAFVFVGLLVAAVLGRGAAPSFFRDALWLAAPLLALGLVFGYVEEVRQYMELYPVLVGALAAGRAPSAAAR